MVNQLYDGNPPERPRTKISQFARSDFLNPLRNHMVEVFPTTLFVFQHNNPSIIQEVDSIPDDPKVLSHISPGADQNIVEGSHQGMFSLQLFKRYELEAFQSWVVDCLEKVDPKVEIFQSWINKGPKGSKQVVHTHANSRISGVYYHNTTPDQGGIVFMNPNPYSKMCMWGTEEGRHFPATPNTLVLFPSWLEHKTTENRSDNLRVSVAFNAR